MHIKIIGKNNAKGEYTIWGLNDIIIYELVKNKCYCLLNTKFLWM